MTFYVQTKDTTAVVKNVQSVEKIGEHIIFQGKDCFFEVYGKECRDDFKDVVYFRKDKIVKIYSE